MMHGLGSMDIVGDEAVSAEVQATSLMMKNICTSKIKIHKYGEIGTEGVMYYVKLIFFLHTSRQISVSDFYNYSWIEFGDVY